MKIPFAQYLVDLGKSDTVLDDIRCLVPACNVEGFTEERSGEVGTLGGNTTWQRPFRQCGKRARSIHPPSSIAAGLSRFSGRFVSE